MSKDSWKWRIERERGDVERGERAGTAAVELSVESLSVAGKELELVFNGVHAQADLWRAAKQVQW